MYKKVLFELAPTVIHLWICKFAEVTDPALSATYADLLDDQERGKMQRLKFPQHRQGYCISHALVRTALSHYQQSYQPQDWRFCYNDYGKPEIVAEQNPTNLQFNLSHCDDMAVCAVTLQEPIGVDIEHHSSRNAMLPLAERYFAAAEVHALTALPVHHQHKRFFDYWTLKEAYIKAHGKGLSMQLDQVCFDLDTAGVIKITTPATANKSWYLQLMDLTQEHTLAICRGHNPNNAEPSLITRRIVPLSKSMEQTVTVRARSGLKTED